MKMFPQSHSRPLITALAVLATGLVPRVAANSAFGGDTIGSHPDHQGTGGPRELETRPVFFLEGPRSLLFDGSPAYHAFGPGEVIGVPTLDPERVRFEFSPDLTVTIPMDRLADPRVVTGFRVSPRGGATKVRWDLGEHTSPCQTLPIGASVELPVTRLRRTGALQEGLGFSAFHRTSGRTRFSISSSDCALLIRPD